MLAISAFSVTVYAEKTTTGTTTTDISTLSNWPVVLLVLMAMLGLIFALAWFIKRFGGLNVSGSRDIRVISAIPVGTRERIALLDVKGQQFLVGVTAHQITHLHSFDQAIVQVAEPGSAFKQSEFFSKLQTVMNPQKKMSDTRPVDASEAAGDRAQPTSVSNEKK
jgi:flagellar protein FliO/FliZ